MNISKILQELENGTLSKENARKALDTSGMETFAMPMK